MVTAERQAHISMGQNWKPRKQTQAHMNKEAKNKQRKDSLFSKQCLENLDSRRQKNEMDHYLTPYTEIKMD